MNGGRLSVSTKHIAKEEKSGIRIISTIKKYWFIYLLAIPGFIFLVFFSYGPMYGIVLAFKDYKMNLGVLGSPWVGLAHYRELLSDPSFIQAFKNTIIINIYNLIFGFSFNVFLALMINEVQIRRLKSIVQTCVYLPYFLSWVIFAGLVHGKSAYRSHGRRGCRFHEATGAVSRHTGRHKHHQNSRILHYHLSGCYCRSRPHIVRSGGDRWREPQGYVVPYHNPTNTAQRGRYVSAQCITAFPFKFRSGV